MLFLFVTMETTKCLNLLSDFVNKTRKKQSADKGVNCTSRLPSLFLNNFKSLSKVLTTRRLYNTKNRKSKRI
jgi:hypothetical protein